MKILKEDIRLFNFLVAKFLEGEASETIMLLEYNNANDKNNLFYLKAISLDILAKQKILELESETILNFKIPQFSTPLNIFFILPRNLTLNENFSLEIKKNISNIFSSILLLYKKNCDSLK